jgi:hypothetical protein
MSATIVKTAQLAFLSSTGMQQSPSVSLPSVSSTVSAYELSNLSIGTATATVALPIATVTSLWIYNGSSIGTLSVNWTPAGGSPETVITLTPGTDLQISGGAITALLLSASQAATPVSLVIGG